MKKHINSMRQYYKFYKHCLQDTAYLMDTKPHIKSSHLPNSRITKRLISIENINPQKDKLNKILDSPNILNFHFLPKYQDQPKLENKYLKDITTNIALYYYKNANLQDTPHNIYLYLQYQQISHYRNNNQQYRLNNYSAHKHIINSLFYKVRRYHLLGLLHYHK